MTDLKKNLLLLLLARAYTRSKKERSEFLELLE
jgi:hypothetical protein